jgi:hypothetical protein
VGSLTLRPGDLLTLLARASSIGFIGFVSSTDAIQATGVLTSSPVGLTPTEHACLYWTHCLLYIRPPCYLRTYAVGTKQPIMLNLILRTLFSVFRSRQALILENAALRHQI